MKKCTNKHSSITFTLSLNVNVCVYVCMCVCVCERKLTPGVHLRDVSLQHLRRHVDSIVVYRKTKRNK
jgi:hypothetical protein